MIARTVTDLNSNFLSTALVNNMEKVVIEDSNIIVLPPLDHTNPSLVLLTSIVCLDNTHVTYEPIAATQTSAP